MRDLRPAALLTTTANVLMCGMALVVAWSAWSIVRDARQSRASASQPPPSLTTIVGKTAPAIGALKYSDADATVLFVLRSTCKYCAESAPALRAIAVAAGQSDRRVKTVVVGTEPVQILRDYLRQQQIAVDLVESVTPGGSLVAATPRTLIVANDGTVIGDWMGRIADGGPIIAALPSRSPGD
jgi:hypothetical protein